MDEHTGESTPRNDREVNEGGTGDIWSSTVVPMPTMLLLSNLAVSAKAVRLYGVLLSEDGPTTQTWSYEDIAAMMGWRPETVERLLYQLEQAGWYKEVPPAPPCGSTRGYIVLDESVVLRRAD
jgi:hypothetical protein